MPSVCCCRCYLEYVPFLEQDTYDPSPGRVELCRSGDSGCGQSGEKNRCFELHIDRVKEVITALQFRLEIERIEKPTSSNIKNIRNEEKGPEKYLWKADRVSNCLKNIHCVPAYHIYQPSMG